MLGKRLVRRAVAALPPPIRSVAREIRRRIPFPYNLGWAFGRAHATLWESQWHDANTLRALQERELRRVVTHAATTVPAYREMFRRLSLRPADVRTIADLAQLPLTTKAELQERPNAYLSEAVPEHRRIRHTTSGSTGTPLAAITTQHSWVAEKAAMYRGWRWAGYRQHDRIVTCVGPLSDNNTGGRAPIERWNDYLDISPHHLDEVGCRQYVDILREFNPHFIRTYPSVFLILGKHMAEQGVKLPELKALLTHSEVIYPEDQRELEATWGAPVRDYYGMQEKCVAMSECERGQLHLHAELGVVELVATEYEPFRQVVATGFFNPAMPLLRYATGDLAVEAKGRCGCGRAHETIERLIGRIEDFIYRADGSPALELDAIIAPLQHIRECQIVQETLEHTRVRLRPAPPFTEADEQTLVRALKDELGGNVRITVEHCDALERTSSGKLRFLVSKLDPGWQP